MESTWILVANASTARLFVSEDPRRSLRLAKDFQHPQSRMKDSDLVADRPGHGIGNGIFVPASDPHEQEAEAFAAELAAELERGRVSGECRRIVLIASPSFLGLLGGRMSAGVQALVSDTLQKDYTRNDEKSLQAILAEAFGLK